MSYVFWRGLAAMNAGAGLAAEWRRCLGNTYDLLAPFLVPAGGMEDTHPCTARPGCGCRHVVRETRGGLRAVCTCGGGVCTSFGLRRADLALLEVDRVRFGGALCRALSLAPVAPGTAAVHGPEGLWQIGLLPNPVVPVWFGLGSPSVESVEAVLRPGPVVLLVPAPGYHWRACRLLLAEQGSPALELATLVSVEPGAVFRAEASLESLLAPWFSRERASGESALRGIRRELRDLRRELVPPRVPEPIEADTARRLFEVVRELESGGAVRKAPLIQVYRLYCLEGLSAAQVAGRCGCSKTLVLSRLGELQRKLGRAPRTLRRVSGHLEAQEDSYKDGRARHLRQQEVAGRGAGDW